MEFWQWIGLMCFVAAGTIFAMLCVTFKSVWIDPPKVYKGKIKSRLEKKFDVPKMPTEDYDEDCEKCDARFCDSRPDYPHKETKYNKTWERVWDK